MKKVIQFSIEEDKEDGGYVASGINAPIVTNGKTFEKLQENMREAISLYLEEVKKDFVKSPAVIANFELFFPKYA